MSESHQTKVNNREEAAEEFTLEQILSEYKSEAFMRNERKLPKETLEAEAERIIAEVRRGLEAPEPEQEAEEVPLPEVPEEAPDPAPAEAAPAELPAVPEVPEEAPGDGVPAVPQEDENTGTEATPEPEPDPGEAAEAEAIRIAEQAAAAAALEAEKAAREAEEARRREEKAREKEELRARREEEKESRKKNRAAELAERRRRKEEERAAREEEKRQARQQWLQKMADLGPAEAAEKYASGIRSLQNRTLLAFALCLLLCLLTLLGGRENAVIPFLRRQGSAALAMLVFQVLTMACGLDILAKGIGSLAAARPGIETLVTFANVAALGDALWIIRGSSEKLGMPYCAAASLVLAFAMLGTRMGRSALRDSFRTMRGARIPTVVQMEPELTDLGPVITKHLGGYRGFIARMLQQDPVEELYRKLSLLLIVICAALSVLTSLVSGDGALLHALAGMSIAAASTTALLAYHRPFALIARRLAGRGAAIAGWSGAEELGSGEGLVLRDGDLFPEKTVSITGMKVLSGTRVEQVVSYTGSMILTSGSALGRAFSELMRQYAAPTRRAEEFQYDADGGYSAAIAQDRVYVGSSAYMSLKGIRIPANIDVSGAVYTAVNGKLCALFIVDHTPADSVRSALLSLRESRLRPIFAIRDFNVTPAMVKSKFRLPEEVSFPPAEDRFLLSADPDPEEAEPPAAVMTREGLGHYLEVVRSGRRMIRAVRRLLTMTLLGSLIAVILIALSVARGAYVSISAWNLVVYLLGWTGASLLLSDNAEGD